VLQCNGQQARLHLGFVPTTVSDQLDIYVSSASSLPHLRAAATRSLHTFITRKDGHGHVGAASFALAHSSADAVELCCAGSGAASWRAALASLPCVVSTGSAGGLARGQLVVRRSLASERNRTSVSSVLEEPQHTSSFTWRFLSGGSRH
jgi:hypothetical protein